MMWRAEELAALLPDQPRFVEVRGLLLSGRARIDVGRADAPTSFVVADADAELACVVGNVAAEIIRGAAAEVHEVLAFDDNVRAVREALLGWSCERAYIFERLAEGPPSSVGRDIEASPQVETSGLFERGFPEPTDAHSGVQGAAHVVSPEQLRALLDESSTADRSIPPHLVEELRRASGRNAPCGVAFDGAGTPAAFCYAAWLTESLWDVSIETLPTHRRQGYAAAAVEAMEHYWASRGRRPVWGGLESNRASLALAAKLGFTHVDSLYVLSR